MFSDRTHTKYWIPGSKRQLKFLPFFSSILVIPFVFLKEKPCVISVFLSFEFVKVLRVCNKKEGKTVRFWGVPKI